MSKNKHFYGRSHRRNGTVVVIVVLFLGTFLVLASMAVDIGYLVMAKGEIQRTADTAYSVQAPRVNAPYPSAAGLRISRRWARSDRSKADSPLQPCGESIWPTPCAEVDLACGELLESHTHAKQVVSLRQPIQFGHAVPVVAIGIAS